jgi:signal peptidase I
VTWESMAGFLEKLAALGAISFCIAWAVRRFLVQTYRVSSESMFPTLEVGDVVVVRRQPRRAFRPRRGDVVAFVPPQVPTHPNSEGRYRPACFSVRTKGVTGPRQAKSIKRVIALGGDTVEVVKGTLVINGRPLLEPYVVSSSPSSDHGPLRVRSDSIFLIGDDRQRSWDSRDYGEVELGVILGRAMTLIWPPQHFRLSLRTQADFAQLLGDELPKD